MVIIELLLSGLVAAIISPIIAGIISSIIITKQIKSNEKIGKDIIEMLKRYDNRITTLENNYLELIKKVKYFSEEEKIIKERELALKERRENRITLEKIGRLFGVK